VRTNHALVVLLVAATLPAASEPGLEVELPAGRPTVGQRLEVEVVARGGEGLLWGDLAVAVPADGSWQLVDGPHPEAGSSPPVWRAVLAPMRLGELELPDFGVTVRSSDGQIRQVKGTALPKVTVVSVVSADDAGQPAPLRDPVGARGLPWEWLLPGLAAGLPVAAVLAFFLARRRRRVQASAPEPASDPFPELEAAARAIAADIGRQPEDVVCDRIAGALRRYLERRTGEPALEMTSFELRLLGRRRGWPETVQRAVQSVMGVADAVRFAGRSVVERTLTEGVASALEAGRGLEAHLQPSPEAGTEAVG
jgi:hypothetical protein